MNEQHPDQLDDLLRQWANGRSASEEQTRQLGDRITDSLGEETFRVLDELAVERSRAIRSRNVMAGISAVAALILIAVIGSSFLSRPPPPSEITPEFAWLTDQQIQQKRMLWADFDQTFDQRLTWIAETSDHVEFGLAEVDSPAPANSRPVAVRIVVARRSADGGSWQPVWAVDVVARSEQVVRLPRQSKNSADLTMWAYVLPDGNVALDTTLEVGNHKLYPAGSSSMQQDRKPTRVFTQEIDGVEYQIFQTVALLDGSVG